MARILVAPFSRARALLMVVAFALFVLNALGVAEIRLAVDGDIGLNSQVVGDLLRGRIATPLLTPDFLVFTLLGAVLMVGLPLLAPIGASLLTLCCMLPPIYLAWSYPQHASAVPLDYTLLAILVLFAVNVLSSYFIETHERHKIVMAFGQYVPPPVVERIAREPQAFSMAGETRDLTVLFCDIKKFSTISEQLEPTALAAMLNTYLTVMTDVLHQHGATIDKYMGDAIMAFWGAPLRQSDHATRAVRAAMDMRERLHELHASFHDRGWPPIEAGFGIASGLMNVGNMGSRYRIAYTVLGDAVNLAARLEALTRLYGVDILISETTAQAADITSMRELDHVRVRGKGQSTRIFEPLSTGAVDEALLAAQRDALTAYYAGDWPHAVSLLRALAARDPGFAWYGVLSERIEQRPCPSGWQGIVSFRGELAYSVGATEAAAAPA